jgi:serine/threonine-protein kinase
MTTRLPSLKSDKVSIDVDAASPRERVSVDLSARLEVRDLLGEGGMGCVFVAHDRGLGRIVALKRLREDYAKDRGAMRRFVLEAQIGAQLEHPNIVPLYSFEQSESGSPAITMQLLEGTTMEEYIDVAANAPAAARAVRGEYSLKERIGTLLGVGEAIHFAHERGVIHRDLKPGNVMLGRYREVYVMDWGLARVLGSPIDMARERQSPNSAAEAAPGGDRSTKVASLSDQHAPTIASLDGPSAMATRQGSVMGTAQYMPPEQALGRIDRVGTAADQYAIGVMLQELATLRPARSHTNLTAALSQAVQGQLEEPIDVAGKQLHPALLAIIQRATRAEPEARYPSVREMTEDLRRFIRDEPVSVYPEGIARKLVRAAARRPALAFAILSLLGFIASVAVVGAVVLDARKTERQARQLESTRRVLIAVSSRAHLVDVELSDLAANVKAVGAATVELLEGGGAQFDRKPPVLPPLAPSEAYGGAPVSFEGIAFSWPGMAPGAELPLALAKLVHVERRLRDCLVDALPASDRYGSPLEQAAALAAGRSALLRGFVGLSDGSFVQYPARAVPRDFDPRKRPWYTMGSRNNELHWTRPVVDMAHKTLRISALLGLRSGAQFLGVAGCDLRVSSFAKKLRLDLPGFRQAYLVTEDGKIAASETLEANTLATVMDPDQEIELPSVDEPELARRLAGSDRGGYVDTGDRLLVFSKLFSPPWAYVVELEKKHYVEE